MSLNIKVRLICQLRLRVPVVERCTAHDQLHAGVLLHALQPDRNIWALFQRGANVAFGFELLNRPETFNKAVDKRVLEADCFACDILLNFKEYFSVSFAP